MLRFSNAVVAMGWGAGLLLACNAGPQPAGTNTTGASEGQEQPATHGPACGKVICAVGEVCCNPSCSVCTAPDGMCTQQLCMDDEQRAAIEAQTESPATNKPATKEPPPAPEAEPSGMSCANVRCMAGTHCKMVQVQCVRAPCNPVPQCTPDATTTPTPTPAPGPVSAGPACGKKTCAVGQTCCNASCGICTAPGDGCIKMFCHDREDK